MIESNLKFNFENQAIKFDNTKFYDSFKSYFPEGKGVDFLSKNSEAFIMMEVKNCSGYEKENIWRTKTDFIRENGEESLDIEVAKKVGGTLTCLFGSGLSDDFSERNELRDYFNELSLERYAKGKRKLLIILFLEGDFGSKTRSKKMIMKRIRDKIAEKLKWLNCDVKVVDTHTYANRYFEVTRVS